MHKPSRTGAQNRRSKTINKRTSQKPNSGSSNGAQRP